MNENLFWDALEASSNVLEGSWSFGEIQAAITALEPAMVWAYFKEDQNQLVILRELYRLLVNLREARCRDLH